jgi:hypothetical protein
MKTLKTTLLLLALLAPALLQAQTRDCNFSGYEDMRLEKKSRSAQEFLDMMSQSLPGGSQLPAYPGEEFRRQQQAAQPGIEAVMVICDADTSLRGQIYYQNLESGFFRVEAMNARHEPIAQIPPVIVAPKDGELEFTLRLNTKLPEAQYFRSQYLKITWLKKRDDANGRSEWFAMSKKWKNSAPVTAASQTLRLTPVKSAASLSKSSLPVPGTGALARLPRMAQASGDDKTPQGPNPGNHISLFGDVRSDVPLSSKEISSIELNFLFADKNPASNVYYYMPAAYYLDWDETGGFDFSILYGTAASPDGEGQVNMQASLSGGITQEEHQLVLRLLQARLGTSNAPELRPLLPESQEAKFHGEGFVLDHVSALAPSSIFDPIQISWQTDVINANQILTALTNNQGLSGAVAYRIGERTHSPSATVRLEDPGNFGALTPDWAAWRAGGWTNNLPYPIQFKYLHVLALNSGSGQSVPCVYSWKVDGATVQPGAKAKPDLSGFPQWLEQDGRVLKAWFSYAVQPCTNCTEELLDEMTTGTSSSREKWVRIQSLGMLRKYDANLMKVTLRSKLADPKGKSAQEVTISIEQDNQNYSLGPLYAWMDKDMQYEIRLSLVNEETEVAGKWISGRDIEVYITQDFMRRAFGNSIRHP